MAFDYLTGTGGQAAQSVITSSEPIVVSVASVKYAGGGEDVGQALSSMAVNGSLGPGMLVAPFFEKAGGGGNDTDSLQSFNPANGPTDLAVAFR
jgi:hypothetical protein